MAHSLESRVPFLDNDLVDFAMRCPVALKLNNLKEVVRLNENEPGDKSKSYFQKTKDGKQILRDVMGRYIPDDISKAEKQGFSAPDASWFKGDSIEYAENRLFKESSCLYNFVDFQTCKTLLNKHLNGDENKRLLVWSLLNVDEWVSRHER